MVVRATRTERLRDLGRVAAIIAREIRNSLAAARLQGENALAGEDQHRCQAIAEMLGRIGRLDQLLSELLPTTQWIIS